MLKLYQFPKPQGFPNYSPFCVKLETYLTIAGIPYERRYSVNLARNPKKKMPYIELDGEIIGDSTFIIDKLIQLHGDKVDAWLTPEQHAISLGLQRLLENHLTSMVVYFRGVYPAGLKQFTALAFQKFSKIKRLIVGYLYKRKLAARFKYSPVTAGFTTVELLARAKKDFDALATYLGDKPYIFGNQPCSVDAMMLGIFGGIVCIPIETPLKELANQYPTLKNHSLRLLEKYYCL